MDTEQASDDGTLVEMMRSDDEVKSNLGLSRWMERDKSKIERDVYRHNAFLFEDIAQDVFWTAYRNIRSGKYQERANLTGYAYGIASKMVLAQNRRRDNRNQPLEKVGEDNEMYEQDIPDSCQEDKLETIEAQADRIPALEWLSRAYYTKLSPDKRELLHYIFVEEKGLSEVAVMLGEKSGTIRQRYNRLLSTLRKSAKEAGIVALDH